MNDWQMMKQVQYLIRLATWSDGTVAFSAGSVLPTAAVPEDQIAGLRMPVCILQSDGSSTDQTIGERPDLVQMEFGAYILAANEGDQWGESGLVGRNRGTGSDGRGVLEVAEIARTALLQVGPDSGLPIVFRSQSAPAAVQHPSLQYVTAIALKFQAWGTIARAYQAPFGLVATGGVASVVLTWSAMPRFDFLSFVLRRAAGATPPATATDGTGVTLASAGALGVTNSGLSAGTYSYSLFVEYDDVGAGATTGTSAPQTYRSVAVT